jgi:cystathionine beta-synthase
VFGQARDFNPGNSIKDRMAVIDDRGRRARRACLKPGGTIVECTVGNTGMGGWRLPPVIKGYRLRLHHTDKQSKEKIDALKGFGCRGHRLPDRRRIPRPALVLLGVVEAGGRDPGRVEGQPVRQPVEHRGALRADGPEIWEQTAGAVTHLVVGVGTGGTISGIGRYLKERNPKIKVWGIDTYGSVFKKYKETGSSTRTRSTRTSPKGLARTSCPRT